MNLLKLTFLLAASIILSFCATTNMRTSTIPDKIFINDLNSNDPEEMRGFRDGCSAAKDSLNLGNKITVPAGNSNYKNAWIKSNAICLEKGMNYLYKFKQPKVQPVSKYEAMEQEMIWNELKK